MKLRLHGTAEELKRFSEYLDQLPQLRVLSRSENYPDRGKSVYERIYMDVELKAPDENNVTAIAMRGNKVLRTFTAKAVAVFGFDDGGIIAGNNVDFYDMVFLLARFQQGVTIMEQTLAVENGVPFNHIKQVVNEACAEMEKLARVTVEHKKGGAE